MNGWFERGSTRDERLRLTPDEVFAAGLRGATGPGVAFEAGMTPSGLRLDVASFGTLAFIDHLIAAGTSPESFEMAMVAFDVVRDRLGSLGEVGGSVRLALFEQLAPDIDAEPVLGRWLIALVQSIDSRRDFDAAVTFLEETRRLWLSADVITAINDGRTESPTAHAWSPGLLVTLGGRPIAPADAAVVRMLVEERARVARPGPAWLPMALDPLIPQPDKILAFLGGLGALPDETRQRLNGCTLELEAPALGLCGASGVSAKTLAAGFDLVVEGSGALPGSEARVRLRLPGGGERHAADVVRDLDDVIELHGVREAQLDAAQAALDALTPGPRRQSAWLARNEAFIRLGMAASVGVGLVRSSATLGPLSDRVARLGRLFENDATNLPPIGGMPSAAASGPVLPPPALGSFAGATLGSAGALPFVGPPAATVGPPRAPLGPPPGWGSPGPLAPPPGFGDPFAPVGPPRPGGGGRS